MGDTWTILASHLLARRDLKPKREPSGVIAFRCPVHEDRTPSAWLGTAAWGCHACNAGGNLQSLAQLLHVEVPRRNGGYPIEQYADDKGFPLTSLRAWGIKTRELHGQALTYIPYRDADGNLLRGRYRAPGKIFWDPEGSGVYLYGQEGERALRDGQVLLVEGESDCHALWLMGLPAVGVPGAKSWRSEWKRHLGNAEPIAWQEPDEAGEAFVEKLALDLPNLRVIQAPEKIKDPADLYGRHGPVDGASRMRDLMLDAALPGEAPPPPYRSFSMTWVNQAIESLEAPVDATPTPWPTLNRIARGRGGGKGIGRGWFVVLGAKLKTGKSIYTENLIAKAVRSGETASYISAEMAQHDSFTRLMAIFSGEDIRTLEFGDHFDKEAWVRAGKVLAAERERSGGVLLHNDRQIWKLEEIVATIRAQHEREGATFFAVDYLQLVKAPGYQMDQVYGHTLETARALMDLVQELGVTIVGVAQLRTALPWKQSPNPHDIAHGGAWSNDADMVLLIDQSKSEKEHYSGAWKHVLKVWQRHGESGVEIPLIMDTKTLRVRELTAA